MSARRHSHGRRPFFAALLLILASAQAGAQLPSILQAPTPAPTATGSFFSTRSA